LSKTIKELADELGLSKDKVKYQTRKLPSGLTTKKNGVTHLTKEAISIIKSNLVGKDDQVRPPQSLPIDFVLEELKKRDIELAEKNSQINNLQQALSTQQKLLDQQQVLTLQANQKIFALETSLEEKNKDNPVSEEPKKSPSEHTEKTDQQTMKFDATKKKTGETSKPLSTKKGFFSRWFN
jgi:hypothetical protein